MRAFVLFLFVFLCSCDHDEHSGSSGATEGRSHDRAIVFDDPGPIDWGTPPPDEHEAPEVVPPPEPCAGSCAPVAPEGWIGVLAWTGAGEPPACPGEAAPTWDGGAGIVAPPATCAPCSCGEVNPADPPVADYSAARENVRASRGDDCGEVCPADPASCSADIGQQEIHLGRRVYRDASGGLVASGDPAFPGVQVGQCFVWDSPGAAYAPIAFEGGGEPITAHVRPSGLSGGSCSSAGGGELVDVPAASFAAMVRECPAELAAGSCEDGRECRLVHEGFRACVRPADDKSAACPESFPDRVESRTSIQDSRACSSCSCGAPVGSVLRTSFAFWPNACEGSPSLAFEVVTGDGESPWTCVAAEGLERVRGVMVGPVSAAFGACAPEGGEPIGEATAAGASRVLCCAP